jgi:hypothetical protein
MYYSVRETDDGRRETDIVGHQVIDVPSLR